MRYLSTFILILFLCCRTFHPSGSFVDYNAGRYDNALELALEDIKAYPLNPENYYLVGICYGKLNKYNNSLKYLKRALKLSEEQSSSLQKRILMEISKISYTIADKYQEEAKTDSSIFYYRESYNSLLKYTTIK